MSAFLKSVGLILALLAVIAGLIAIPALLFGNFLWDRRLACPTTHISRERDRDLLGSIPEMAAVSL